jgi:hypothetical protein
LLENSGTTGSQEPEQIYELYRMKGMKERALKYRQQFEKNDIYNQSFIFKRVDEKYPDTAGSGGNKN